VQRERIRICPFPAGGQIAVMLRFWPLLLGALLLSAPLGAAPPNLGRFATVDAEPVKTSIYLGSVTLSASEFHRQGQMYAADYTAKVFPFFFLSEAGQMRIAVPDESLQRLDAGQAIEFTGTAVRSDGRRRVITGRILPLTATTGKLKVRLIVNRSLTLVFDSAYRLPGSSQ
jgi:hypothetical protein